MKSLELTFPTPAENLACDEALLDHFEEHGGRGVLRFWEAAKYFVVVGYGNHVQKEVDVAACESGKIPILRRCSGGGTVLQGPGCLNYSLVLKADEQGPLRSITSANRFIMERNRAAIEAEVGGQRADAGVEIRGCTDLALVTHQSSLVTALKFSGNAQRRKKHFLLFHGTFLLNFDLPLVSRFLRMPSKEPDYREGRAHENFLTNLRLATDVVKRSLREAWGAQEPLANVPRDAIGLLTRDKYVTDGWNFKF